MKKILLSLLLLCTLGYSSAWAFDTHIIGGNSEAGSVFQQADDSYIDISSEQYSDADIACDHSCHISAHLQAIFTQNGLVSSMYQSGKLLELSETSITFVVSPDLRPPRV